MSNLLNNLLGLAVGDRAKKESEKPAEAPLATVQAQDHADTSEASRLKESLDKTEPEVSKPKPPSRWSMEPPATMVIQLDLDRMTPATALGSLLMLQDVVRGFYADQAQQAAQRKNRIIKPSMVDRTEAILNRRPS